MATGKTKGRVEIPYVKRERSGETMDTCTRGVIMRRRIMMASVVRMTVDVDGDIHSRRS